MLTTKSITSLESVLDLAVWLEITARISKSVPVTRLLMTA